MSNILQKQDKLQKEAKEVIKILNIKSILNKYGNSKIVGSLDHGLMTWRDIDIDLVTHKEPSYEDYWSMVKELFSKNGVTLITLVDNRKSGETNRPTSMYVGIKYQDKASNEWKIDIRMLSQKHVVADKTKKLIRDINIDTKMTILEIKSQVHDNPNYHKEFSSIDIYEAVLHNKVKNLAEFIDYLKKSGKKY